MHHFSFPFPPFRPPLHSFLLSYEFMDSVFIPVVTYGSMYLYLFLSNKWNLPCLSHGLAAIFVRLYGCSFWCSKETQSHDKLSSDFYNLSLFLQWSGSLKCSKCIVEVSVGSRLHKSVFWLFAVFCNDFYLLKRETSLMRVEDYIYLCR